MTQKRQSQEFANDFTKARFIVYRVCELLGVKEDDLKTASHKHTYSDARRLCVYLIRDLTRLRYIDIADVFFPRGTSALIRGNEYYVDMLKYNPEVRREHGRVMDVVRRDLSALYGEVV